jgi:quercetin dioxygenase-like cupin family protein
MTELAYRYYPASELQLEPDVPGARFFAVALRHAMLTYFEVEAGAEFPEHEHESEQITLVLSGRLRFRIADDEILVGPGEVIALPGHVRHAVSSLDEPVRAVDAWSPVRPRYSSWRT